MANDVKMMYIDDDIQKIQTKSNMYIRQYGPEGAFHLAREIIQNSIDECIDTESMGDKIDITYDIKSDILVVDDNGRGFPEKDYPIDIFCTKIQSGSKFFRDQGGSSSGEFGVGLTVVNALSSLFTIENRREVENEYHIVSFSEGEKTKDTKRALKASEKKHGCRVTFACSQKYLGANAKLPYTEMIDWIEKLSFFLPKGIKIRVDITNGDELVDTRKFKARDFENLLDKIASDTYSPKTHFKGSETDMEEITSMEIGEDGKTHPIKKKVKRSYVFEVAFRYDAIDSTEYDSYCNFTNTTDGGVHQETFDQVYCRYMFRKVNETMSDAQKEKLKINWDDIRTGLCAVMNLDTNAQVGFVGNAKTKIDAKGLVPYLTKIIQNGLDEFFAKNQGVLSEYIKIVKVNAKARIESAKVKDATKKERINSFKEHDMKKYVRCNNTGKRFKELFLVEGDSASGSCVDARDPDTQALFLFKGVTANPLKCSLAKIMENEEWRSFVQILRCGVGKNCDVDKLYFDRINIFTDSDTDGYGISSGMLVFIYTYLRPLIEAGKVYKVFSPLYRLDDKNHEFVINKSEMIEYFFKKIRKKYDVKVKGMKDWFDKEEIMDFLSDTYSYRESLIRVADSLGGVSKFLVEAIVAVISLSVDTTNVKEIDTANLFDDPSFVRDLLAIIQTMFKEVRLDGDTVKGVVNGKFSAIKVNDRFIRQMGEFLPIFRRYGFELVVREKDGDERVMTIASFLDEAQKLMPKIKTRYKGLGEANAKDLHSTSMDMNNRISVRYTTEDAERETEIFSMLHGDGKQDLLNRKEMMMNYHLSREDLDN